MTRLPSPRMIPQTATVAPLATSRLGRLGEASRVVVSTLWRYSPVMHSTPMMAAIHSPLKTKAAPTSRRSRVMVSGATNCRWVCCWPGC